MARVGLSKSDNAAPLIDALYTTFPAPRPYRLAYGWATPGCPEWPTDWAISGYLCIVLDNKMIYSFSWKMSVSESVCCSYHR